MQTDIKKSQTKQQQKTQLELARSAQIFSKNESTMKNSIRTKIDIENDNFAHNSEEWSFLYRASEQHGSLPGI